MKDNNNFLFKVIDLQKFVQKKGNNNSLCSL